MVFTQEEKSESMITIIRTEVTMDEDALTEKLNPTEKKDAGNGLVENEKFLDSLNIEKNEKCPENNNGDYLFDTIMDKIGTNGKFQKRFDLIYNFILLILVSMPYLNLILAMTVPKHWCYVPGRELTNLTVEEWKAKHIPLDASKQNEYSSCKMYQMTEYGPNNTTIVDCQFGWEYDREWYTETAPSLQNWVCDKEVFVSNSLAAGRVGEIIGTLIFGQLGDSLGRRPVFYMSLALLIVGRILSVFTSDTYYLFVISVLIGGTATISIFQSPMAISMEVSDARNRNFVAFLQCVGWVVGLCILPLLAWAVRDWKWIILVSTLPGTVYFFMYKLLPESPRWLASKGNIKEAKKVLESLAKLNGTKCPENTDEILQKIKNRKDKFYGIPTLFLHWRLAKNTILLNICWGLSGMCYYILILNVTTMGGNPFMNFFWQSMVELPGYVCGKVLSNLIGRRWTQTGSYTVATLLCGIVLCILPLKISLLETLFVSLLKLCLTTTFYMVWLQAMEIYPTCVRQTGTSFGGMAANITGILAPYLVLLGTTIHQSIPYVIILASMVVSTVSSSFLPETHNQKLPETLEDAQNFGKDQKFWTFKIYRSK